MSKMPGFGFPATIAVVSEADSIALTNEPLLMIFRSGKAILLVFLSALVDNKTAYVRSNLTPLCTA